MIRVEASEQRMEAAIAAGVLALALDAAVSAEAHAPIEKMLCHQLSALHFAAMRLLKFAANDVSLRAKSFG